MLSDLFMTLVNVKNVGKRKNEQHRTQAQAEPGLHPQADPRRTQAHAQARAWNTGTGTSLGHAQAPNSNAGPGAGLDTEILNLTSWIIYEKIHL
jgi:hypothetical protein